MTVIGAQFRMWASSHAQLLGEGSSLPFAYYKRLSARQRRIYDRSVAVATVRLADADRFAPSIAAMARELSRAQRATTELAAGRLTAALLESLRVPPVRVRVLAARPSRSWGELHGLYEPSTQGPPVITVWMRTAQRRQVVAFRTFLRTLLHEIVHHLDYELLELEDSLHTEGFYKRESSLFHQLVPEPAPYEPAAAATPGTRAEVRTAPGRGRDSQAGREPAAGRKPVRRPEGAGEPARSKPAGGRRRRARTEQALLPFEDA